MRRIGGAVYALALTTVVVGAVTFTAHDATQPTPSIHGITSGLNDCRESFDAGPERDDCEGAVLARFYPAPACATEDSDGPCVWDAWSRGDGAGQSFLRYEDGSILNLVTGVVTHP
jgi:hypothetical protein